MKLSLILLFALTTVETSAQVKTDSITAESIINRSINNSGGERLLDSLASAELIYKVVTPEGDTLSVAIKRSGFDKCYISTMGANYQNTTHIYNHGKAAVVTNENAQKNNRAGGA